jgi:hypothetical protein
MPDELTKLPTKEATGERGDDDIAASIDDFLTRGEVAMLLRVSIATVRRLQGKDLHPRRDESGLYLFDPEEVKALRARRPPPPEPRACRDPDQVGAEAFLLFRDGVDARDVVIALKRPPREIAMFYADWERMGHAIVISDEVHTQLERMVRLRLLPQEVLTAIENDSHAAIQEHIAKAVRAHRRQAT